MRKRISLLQGVSTAQISGGTALLQGLKETLFSPFDDLSFQVKMYLKRLMDGNLVVGAVIVFVRYDNPNSVKQMERQ